MKILRLYAELSVNTTVVYEESEEYVYDHLSDLTSEGFVDAIVAFLLQPSPNLAGMIQTL